jgi:hypothetical protein
MLEISWLNRYILPSEKGVICVTYQCKGTGSLRVTYSGNDELRSGRSLLPFRAIIVPLFSGSKKELNNYQEASPNYLLVCPIFYTEDRGSRFSLFASIPLENSGLNISIKSCPLRIKSFPVRHSPVHYSISYVLDIDRAIEQGVVGPANRLLYIDATRTA